MLKNLLKNLIRLCYLYIKYGDWYGRSSSAGFYAKASINIVDIIVAGVILLIAFLIFKVTTSWRSRYLPY